MNLMYLPHLPSLGSTSSLSPPISPHAPALSQPVSPHTQMRRHTLAQQHQAQAQDQCGGPPLGWSSPAHLGASTGCSCCMSLCVSSDERVARSMLGYKAALLPSPMCLLLL